MPAGGEAGFATGLRGGIADMGHNVKNPCQIPYRLTNGTGDTGALLGGISSR